jgi:hypothetical protein
MITVEVEAQQARVSCTPNGSRDLQNRLTRIWIRVGAIDIQIYGTKQEIKDFQAKIANLEIIE